MRVTQSLLPGLLVLTAMLGACVSPEKPKPAPVPVRPAPPVLRPAPAPAPAPPSVEWQDLALTPGNWTYSEGEGRSQASFGASDPSFIIRCDKQGRQIQLLRPGVTTGNTMVLRTTEVARTMPLSVTSDATPYASLGASDPMLDNIAFSRGRFSIDVPGLPMLLIPSWAEPARVIEDCRD